MYSKNKNVPFSSCSNFIRFDPIDFIFISLRGAGAVLVRVRVRSSFLMRVTILVSMTCKGFLVRVSKDIFLNFRSIDSTFCSQHSAVSSV